MNFSKITTKIKAQQDLTRVVSENTPVIDCETYIGDFPKAYNDLRESVINILKELQEGKHVLYLDNIIAKTASIETLNVDILNFESFKESLDENESTFIRNIVNATIKNETLINVITNKVIESLGSVKN